MFNDSSEFNKNSETDDFHYAFDVPVVTNFDDNKIDDVNWFLNRFSGIPGEFNHEVKCTETDQNELESQNKIKPNEQMIPITEDLEDTVNSTVNTNCDENVSEDLDKGLEDLIEEISINENLSEIEERKPVFCKSNKENIEKVKPHTRVMNESHSVLRPKVFHSKKPPVTGVSYPLQKHKIPMRSKQSPIGVVFRKPKTPLLEIKVSKGNSSGNQNNGTELAPTKGPIKRTLTIPRSPKLSTKARAELKQNRIDQALQEQQEQRSSNSSKTSLTKPGLALPNKAKIGAIWK